MTVQDRELVYPPKLQPALDSRLARMRREAGWLMIRGWRLVTCEAGGCDVSRCKFGVRSAPEARIFLWRS
jgi:hypothetical protein